jgi:hypothetical protein
VTLLAVAALVGSLAWGIWSHFHPAHNVAATAAAPSADTGRALARTAPAGRVRVQVLNASGTHGLARTATDVLRDRGFDVVETANAPRGTDPSTSVVYDRVGRLDVARQAADALGIRRVEAKRDANLLLDVTVILGRDWRAPGKGG